MQTVKVKTRLSMEDLLHAAEQLSLYELEKFVRQLVTLQAYKKAPSLSKDESQLVLKINQGIPQDIQKRYEELIAKRQSETLEEDEYNELLAISDQVEKLDTYRIQSLKELADIRHISLSALMKKLGIQTPAYG